MSKTKANRGKSVEISLKHRLGSAFVQNPDFFTTAHAAHEMRKRGVAILRMTKSTADHNQNSDDVFYALLAVNYEFADIAEVIQAASRSAKKPPKEVMSQFLKLREVIENGINVGEALCLAFAPDQAHRVPMPSDEVFEKIDTFIELFEKLDTGLTGIVEQSVKTIQA